MKPPARLFHFSYHKCLTVYLQKVMKVTFAKPSVKGVDTQYVHLNSRIDRFDEARRTHVMVSVNNHLPDLDALGDVRMSRFIRDPRDLLVSGYHYHKRAAEPWCDIKSPQDSDWVVVNGTVPKDLPAGMSYAEYLTSLPLEEGLLAELEWRTKHFESMVAWPLDDPRILCLDYSEVVGREPEAYGRIFDHYGIPAWRKQLGMKAVTRYSASNASGSTAHIRNPEPGQWRKTLTPDVLAAIDERHPGLVERYEELAARATARR